MPAPKTPAEVQQSNAEHFAERGPGLSYGYGTYIVARDPEHDMVLVGGLGSFGSGQMWCEDEEGDKDKPGYAEAPIVECPPEEYEWREREG